MALTLIERHIEDCTQARIDTKNAIFALSSKVDDNHKTILGWVISGLASVVMLVLGFGAYEYIKNEDLTQQHLQTIAAIHQGTAQVVQKVQQTNSAQP